MKNHGDLRAFVTADLWKKIEQVLNQKSARRRPYYIMVLVRPYYQGPAPFRKIEPGPVAPQTVERAVGGHVCHARLILLEQAPAVPPLGTLLFRVDNRRGRLDLIWSLPFDKPNTTQDSDNAGAIAVRAAESARNLRVPLIWS